MSTTAERFDKAVAQARESITVTINVDECCRSCVNREDLGATGEDATGYAWTFAGQEAGIYFDEKGDAQLREEMISFDFSDDDDEVDYYDDEDEAEKSYISIPAREVFFYHGGVAAAQIIADAFTTQGFTVVWDGTESRAVQVNFLD